MRALTRNLLRATLADLLVFIGRIELGRQKINEGFSTFLVSAQTLPRSAHWACTWPLWSLTIHWYLSQMLSSDHFGQIRVSLGTSKVVWCAPPPGASVVPGDPLGTKTEVEATGRPISSFEGRYIDLVF